MREFDVENLKVGDVFYSVKQSNQNSARKKIHQVIDGVDWFRYDRPVRTYEIVTHTVLGIIRKHLEGDWSYGELVELETGFVIRSESETHGRASEFYFVEDKEYFLNEGDALVYKTELEAKAKEMDKQ